MKKIKNSTDRSTEKSLSGFVHRARSKNSIRCANPLDLIHEDFDAAGDLCKKRGETEAPRHRNGVKLGSIVKTIDTYRVDPIQIARTKSAPRETESEMSIEGRCGNDFGEGRSRKLLLDKALAVLAKMSNRSLNDPDLLPQLLLALLIWGSWRMGKVATLKLHRRTV